MKKEHTKNNIRAAWFLGELTTGTRVLTVYVVVNTCILSGANLHSSRAVLCNVQEMVCINGPCMTISLVLLPNDSTVRISSRCLKGQGHE